MASAEEKIQVKKAKQATPTWAWLPADELQRVHIVSVQDPDIIFIRLSQFTECLESLMKEIEKHTSSAKPSANVADSLEVGDVCLGKQSDNNEWNRALILSKVGEDKVELFFVDYGDKEVVPWSQVLPIPNKFITQLPFQVIECYLAGIQFLQQDSESKDWEDEVIDMIYNLSRDDDERATDLAARVCGVETTAKMTKGRRYKVVLANCVVFPSVVLNLHLVACNLAEVMVDELKALEPQRNSSDSEDEGLSTSGKHKALPMIEDKEGEDISDHGEDDADVSDSTSEGSALSLPHPSGALPSSSHSLLALPPAKSMTSTSCTSKSITSSLNSSTVSLHEGAKSQQVQEMQAESHKQSLTVNIPSESCHNIVSSTPIAIAQQSESFTSPKWNIQNLMSTNILGHSVGSSAIKFVQNVSPRLKEVSEITPSYCNDQDDSDFDNTMFEMNDNPKLKNIKTDKVADKEYEQPSKTTDDEKCCLTAETLAGLNVNVEEIKSPRTMAWIEGIPAESDDSRDITIVPEETISNVQAASETNPEVRTPLVEWHQDNAFIVIHIKLPALEDHQLTFDADSIHFRAHYGGVLYEVNLTLYGTHIQSRARGTAEAIYYEIKLEKMQKGKRFRWPRLTRQDQKHHWLKLNAEKACEEIPESEDDDIKRLACTLPCWNEVGTETYRSSSGMSLVSDISI